MPERTDHYTPQPSPATAPWPEGVIARYLTVGGAVVELTERSGYHGVTHPTETHGACGACPATATFDWGWNAYHDEFGTGPQPDFDETGHSLLPTARAWAQAHAETCRALPRPAVTA
ncbi:hypothetical protein [Streptomyces sp. NPDC017941]|uniref:hypothetical protein n=1 Tax=Streptomyces sp. NPDC017941 TaxID=3365018 RepID=UPI00378A82F2